MSESAIKHPRINQPQHSPFAPVEKEKYKLSHLTPAHIKALEHDTSATFDEDENQLFKKLQIGTQRTGPSHFGIPELTAPSQIVIASSPPAKVKPLDETTQSPLKYADSEIEKETFAAFANHRIEYNTSTNLAYEEVRHKQGHRKLLHENRLGFLDELAEHAKKSETFSWMQMGCLIAWGICFLGASVATVLSGGAAGALLGGVLGTGASLAAGGGAVVGGLNGLQGLKTKETEGLFEENKHLSQSALDKQTALITESQRKLDQIYQHDSNVATILKNRSQIRMF